MRFVVGSSLPETPLRVALLQPDNWDDWFKYETTLRLRVRTSEGDIYRIGSLKMGQSPMPGRSADLPLEFETLPDDYFSLGQDESYYESLNTLGALVRDEILSGLNDVAVDLQRFNRHLDQPVMGTSLLRFVSPATVQGQFHRMARGGARLSPYSFIYTAPRTRAVKHEPVVLEFNVVPESMPPTNVHVLIGRNGVGKTHLLNRMAQAVVASSEDDDEPDAGTFSVGSSDAGPQQPAGFANVVSVTFSAFDPFLPISESRNRSKRVQYSYIGLKRTVSPASAEFKSGTGKAPPPKSPRMLASEFARSMAVCLQDSRLARWQRALQMLESDPVFSDVGISDLADYDFDDEELKKQAVRYFDRLSSGHKIVLLSVTRLVETVEERSLVLIDEPEAHLHPPLLAAFVRSLSDLLIDRNGVAIIATHSPVLLQEVPSSCVWLVRRAGMRVDAERPSLETFGENVGILTREVFGLEVTHSGFNRMLLEALEGAVSAEDAAAAFGGQLGGEASALLQAYFVNRNPQDD